MGSQRWRVRRRKAARARRGDARARETTAPALRASPPTRPRTDAPSRARPPARVPARPPARALACACTQVIEENKALLKEKYAEAKALGAAVNSSRARINKLKSHIEQIRVERAMQGLTADGSAEGEEDPEEARNKDAIEKEKLAYKTAFTRLKELKTEIEHLQLMLEQSRKRLQHDFEAWFGVLEKQSATPAAARGAPPAPMPADGGGGAGGGGPQLTGNREVDAEIMAFYRARESLLQQQQQQPGAR